MSLATQREKRKNAGSKLSSLLDDEDEFYSTAYGGFNEEEDDTEFLVKEGDIEDDFVDSDFDIDENEEQVDDYGLVEDNSEFIQRKKIFTKAYKEPKQSKNDSNKNLEENVFIQNEKLPTVKKAKLQNANNLIGENKILRFSTEKKRKELELRQEERDARRKIKNDSFKKNIYEAKRLTQQELLDEAKLTEKLNQAALDAYQKLELEKKKTKSTKNTITGPIIRYHSFVAPICTHGDNEENQKNVNNVDKQARNFITFTDEKSFKNIFFSEKPKVKHPEHCIITGLQAKYFDPLTQCPYANIYAYKALKDIYNQKSMEKVTINGF